MLSSPGFPCLADFKIRWNSEPRFQTTNTTEQNGTAQMTNNIFGKTNDLSYGSAQI